MRTFKEHILEKLKVSTKNTYRTPTYQEYFELLDRYCKTTGEEALDVNETIDNDDSLPKYKIDKSKRSIYTIIPLHSTTTPIIRIMTYDFVLKQSFSYSIFIREDKKDKEVDFMEDEYIEKTVKYMEEHIK